MVRDVGILTQTKWNFWGSALFSKQWLLHWWRDIRYYEKVQTSDWSGEELRKVKPDPETDISANLGGI